ncbi:pyruvate formate-lyase-activating protein [Isoptericola sp. b441]|uniref:Pyruvate formate-lyase-activating enzyme n=1 Tax=Actinotalea lenta TaxID=3064654 RepID=A0ABT9DCK4_9CELL|nr:MULTISPECIES: pyruvate formate-lyase-activating protein [unclassified Isoptericola]MDO8107903.1 pyruvate formate-lyase-activating protein [Isoptericola sp. b441]MDO8120429.1 pyruvate formate-lyase-activating protein [Isoptericola sp. b490]
MSILSERSTCCEDGQATQMAALRAGEIGSVHSWDRSTDADGPGTRLVLRLSGCPLRCQYCHGPDAWLMRDGALHTVDSALARIERDAPVLVAGGGGLTVSGGEPLLQPSFVARVLRGAKEIGVHTVLDTSGYLGRRAGDGLLDDTDLVILDVKSGLPDVYRAVTGRDLAPTLEFARRLADRRTRLWARFVVVPGLTDAWDNVAAVGEHLAALGNVERVEVVAFEQSGREVWHSIGADYRLELTMEPDEELLARVRSQLRASGLAVA